MLRMFDPSGKLVTKATVERGFFHFRTVEQFGSSLAS